MQSGISPLNTATNHITYIALIFGLWYMNANFVVDEQKMIYEYYDTNYKVQL